jgi:cytochrome c553
LLKGGERFLIRKMKNTIAFFLVFTFLLSSCESNESDSVANTNEDSFKACKVDINPNGDSELALLMREMVTWTDSAKAAVESGREIPASASDFARLYTAKKTDTTIDASIYKSGADLYISQVDQFKKAAKEDRVRLFNSMVNGCVACHENFCHGPIKRINKLFIPEGT